MMLSTLAVDGGLQSLLASDVAKKDERKTADDSGSDEAHPESSKTENRPKVLCLGISYPDIRTHMENEDYSEELMDRLLVPGRSSSTELVVECVRRNILTEMDGRDLSRIWAMENEFNVRAYTVSQEAAASYHPQQHVHANFNRTSSFIRSLQKNFGESVRFQQIILDYFWIPKGSWTMSHWARSFFRSTLPQLAAFLEYPDENDTTSYHSSKAGRGVFYLPFCLHCMKELIASLDVVKKYYKISFVYQWELSEHLLWSGTQTIDADTMQQWLGKQRAQEEIYCTFSPRDVREAMEHANVTKGEVIQVLRGIENFQEARMIRLQPLSHHNPALKEKSVTAAPVIDEPKVGQIPPRRKPRRRKAKHQEKTRNANCKTATPASQHVEVGGFVSLLPPQSVIHGYDSLLSKPTYADSVESTAEESLSSSSSECDDSKSDMAEVDIAGDALNSSKPRRLFGPVPDLETYSKLGMKGHAKTTSEHQVDENDHTIGADKSQAISSHPVGRFVDQLDCHELTQGAGSNDDADELPVEEIGFDEVALSSSPQESVPSISPRASVSSIQSAPSENVEQNSKPNVLSEKMLDSTQSSTVESGTQTHVPKRCQSHHASSLETCTVPLSKKRQVNTLLDFQLSTAPLLNLVLRHISLCEVNETDRIGIYSSRAIGSPGFACLFCGGRPGDGRYFPPAGACHILDMEMLDKFCDHFAYGCSHSTMELRKLIRWKTVQNPKLPPDLVRKHEHILKEFFQMLRRLQKKWKASLCLHESSPHGKRGDAEDLALVRNTAVTNIEDRSPRMCSLIGLGANGLTSPQPTGSSRRGANSGRKRQRDDRPLLSSLAVNMNVS